MKRAFVICFMALSAIVLSYGQEWKWSNQLKCNTDVFPSANVVIDISTDNSNNVYYCGHYNANPLTVGSLTIPNSGDWDGFVCKFNSNGTPQWLKQIGGTGRDEAAAMAIVDNFLYVVGSYRSNPCTFAAGKTLSNAGNYDIYLAKYDLNGNCLKATQLFWGTDVDRAKEFVYDPDLKRFVLIGQFQVNTTYYNGTTNDTVTASSSKDMFVAQIDTSGAVTNFKNFRTTNTKTIFKDISLTTNEGYYISGDLTGALYFSPGDSLKTGDVVNTDIMAIKLDKSLNKVWARKGGGSSTDYGNSSTSDEYGSLYLTGMITGNVTFDSTGTLQSNQITADGFGNIFLAKYNKQGDLLWIKNKGGLGKDDGYGLTYRENLIEFCGNYAGTVIFNQDTLKSSSTSDYNTSFAIFDIDGNEIGAKSIGGTLEEAGRAISFDNLGRTLIGGYFYSNPLVIGDSSFTNPSGRDGFIACYSYPFKASFTYTENIKCNGDSTGKLIVTPYFGTGPYTYTWSANVKSYNDSLAYNLKADSYSVTVTDALGAVANASYTITQPTALNITSSVTNVSCHPDNGISNDGAVAITVTGGVGTYNYIWSTLSGSGANPTSEDQTTLTKGIYKLTATDDNSCEAIDTFTIAEPAMMSFTGSLVTDATGGSSNGAIDITVTGGNNPPAYTSFTWSNGAITEDISNVPGGNYSVVVIDSKNCQGDTVFHINDLSLLQVAVVNITDVDCNGNSTGSATVSVTNGSGNYIYDWRNSSNLPVGINSPTLSGVTAGTYYINVIDTIIIDTVSTSLTIQEPAQVLSTVISGVNVLCFGTSTGVASLSVTGGTLPYRYLWSNGSTVEDLVNIPAGSYSVTVTDTNGCTANNNITITAPTPMDINITIDHPIYCYGDQNGILTATATGGTGQKTYLWDDPGNQTGQTANSLFGGTYKVIATDLNGCTIEDMIILSEPDSITFSTVIQEPSCVDLSNGSIILTVNGGTPSYDYVWSNGQFTKNISDIAAGNFTVTVTDANNCSNEETFNVSEPTPVTYSSILFTDASCFGLSDGTINISAQGGVGDYQYSIDGGGIFSTDPVFNTVPSGDYNLVIRDGNNCFSPDSLVTISQPQQIIFNEIVLSTSSCIGTSDASIAISPAGGAGAPYLFSIDNGGNYSSDSSFTGLATGGYTLVISDVNNCTSDSAITINPPAPVVFQGISIISPTCTGDSDAEIEITPGGGSGGPYRFSIDGGVNYSSESLFTGLLAEDFTLRIRDVNNCESLDSIITISNPIDISITSETATDVTCNGLQNGSINIVVSGISSQFEYSIDNGLNFSSNNGIFENLGAGSYQIVIRNENNCMKQGTQLVIDEPDSVTIDTSSVTHANNDINGSIDVLAAGGSSPFIYVLNEEGNDSLTNADGNFQDLFPGEYVVYALDNNSCKSDTIHVTILQLSTELIIYDAFSPNSDGINDVWNIINISQYPTCKVIIFNSWGNTVFSSEGYSKPWDGKYNDKFLPAATYFYVIDLGDGSEVKSGPVSIVR